MKNMYVSILSSISFIALYISFHIIQLLIFLLHILGESAVSSVSLEVRPTSHVLCVLLVPFITYVLPYRPCVHNSPSILLVLLLQGADVDLEGLAYSAFHRAST